MAVWILTASFAAYLLMDVFYDNSLNNAIKELQREQHLLYEELEWLTELVYGEEWEEYMDWEDVLDAEDAMNK